MCSQNSTGTTWRTARVFSRAAANAPAIDERLVGSRGQPFGRLPQRLGAAVGQSHDGEQAAGGV